MQQIIETMSAIFFAVFLTFTGIGIAGGFMTNSRALGFKTETIAMLEECNYDANVVNACFEMAQRAGYELKILFFYKDGRTAEIRNQGVVEKDVENVSMARVTITYPFRIGTMKLNAWLTTEGTAH